MQTKAKELLDGKNLEKTLEIESVLKPELLNTSTVKLIESFTPFGLGNPKPVFVLENVKIKNYKLLGREQEHLKLIVTLDEKDDEFEVLAWGKASLSNQLQLGEKYSLAISMEVNSYRGLDKIQFLLKDFRVR